MKDKPVSPSSNSLIIVDMLSSNFISGKKAADATLQGAKWKIDVRSQNLFFANSGTEDKNENTPRRCQCEGCASAKI